MPSVPEQFITQRLRLRRSHISDAAAIFEYASEPAVIKYMDYGPRTTVCEVEQYLADEPQRWDSGNYSWVLTVKPDDHPIGTIACSIEGHAVNFGYLLNKRYWGHGYATEAATVLVEWAISQPEIYRVWATCDVENLASARILEKCGLSREGRLRAYLIRPNISDVPRDAFIYAKTKQDCITNSV